MFRGPAAGPRLRLWVYLTPKFLPLPTVGFPAEVPGPNPSGEAGFDGEGHPHHLSLLLCLAVPVQRGFPEGPGPTDWVPQRQ